jgi:hypothetical protein
MVTTVFLVFLLVILHKMILNLFKLTEIQRFYLLYKNYVQTPNFGFFQYQPDIIDLMKDAQVESFSTFIDVSSSISVDGLENLNLLKSDVIEKMNERFQTTAVIFRGRIYEALNPIYWIQLVVMLIAQVLAYFIVIPSKSTTIIF